MEYFFGGKFAQDCRQLDLYKIRIFIYWYKWFNLFKRALKGVLFVKTLTGDFDILLSKMKLFQEATPLASFKLLLNKLLILTLDGATTKFQINSNHHGIISEQSRNNRRFSTNSPFLVRVCHDSSSKNSWLCEVSANKTLKTLTQPIPQWAGMATLIVSVVCLWELSWDPFMLSTKVELQPDLPSHAALVLELYIRSKWLNPSQRTCTLYVEVPVCLMLIMGVQRGIRLENYAKTFKYKAPEFSQKVVFSVRETNTFALQVHSVQTKQMVPFFFLFWRTPPTVSKVLNECREEDMREREGKR